MSTPGAELSVRRHDRYLCDLAAGVRVQDGSSAGIRLSKSVLGPRELLNARVVDISRGGLGLTSRVYLPPSSCIRIWVTADGLGFPAVEMEFNVRVHRASMQDRTPSYYIGAAFEELSVEQERSLQQILQALSSAGAMLVPEEARA